MKQIFLLLGFATLTLLSCGEDVIDQPAVDRSIILDYIEANSLNAIEDPSGLYYTVDVAGTEDKPTLSDSVKVRYTGYLTNGSIFDSSNRTGNEPERTVTFLLNDLITGWKIGIPKFGVGGSGLLVIPSALGYGGYVLPGIPANSVLIFEMELVDFF